MKKILPKFQGKVEGGKVIVYNTKDFKQYLVPLDGKEIDLIVEPWRNERTRQQIKYYWGVCVKLISDYTGHSPDEIHEFLPDKGKTSASDSLIQLLREGRQPGLSLVMATQQPGALARDAITQADIIISHRVTAMPDIKALNEIMQSYLLESIKRYMDELPALKGSAIILDDNSERIYPMRIRPRFTWHGGEAPTAIKVEERL